MLGKLAFQDRPIAVEWEKTLPQGLNAVTGFPRAWPIHLALSTQTLETAACLHGWGSWADFDLLHLCEASQVKPRATVALGKKDGHKCGTNKKVQLRIFCQTRLPSGKLIEIAHFQ